MTISSQTIEHHNGLAEYFRNALQHAAGRLDVSLTEHTEYYLVSLLENFQRSEKLFSKEGDHFEETPFAIMLERAVHSDSLGTRIKLFKRMGDTALFFAGLFPDRASHRTVDVDYFIGMGSSAYRSLSTMFNTKDVFTDIYSELGTKFSSCVEIFSVVKKGDATERNADLLEFYERWMHTGCKQLEKILQRAGIPTHQRAITKS